MTNEERTAQGNKVLAFYETLYGVETRADGASFEQVLTDLLADLRHAAAAHDVECFEDAAAKSLMHFECETETEIEDDENPMPTLCCDHCDTIYESLPDFARW